MTKSPVDLAERLSLFTDHWSPKVVATMNDYEIKVVKVQGEFVWHTHDDTGAAGGALTAPHDDSLA